MKLRKELKEAKARRYILKKVEPQSENQIFFKIKSLNFRFFLSQLIRHCTFPLLTNYLTLPEITYNNKFYFPLSRIFGKNY
jgi:hypothetical protein